MTSTFFCYVLGCRDLPVLSTGHKRFGLVATCNSHDPARQGYGVAMVSPVNGSTTTTRNGGGAKVPVSPVSPVIPPSDGAALALCDSDGIPVGDETPEERAEFAALVDQIENVVSRRPSMEDVVNARRKAEPAGARRSTRVPVYSEPQGLSDDAEDDIL
jgi:hypothetical protein